MLHRVKPQELPPKNIPIQIITQNSTPQLFIIQARCIHSFTAFNFHHFKKEMAYGDYCFLMKLASSPFLNRNKEAIGFRFVGPRL